MANKAVTLEDLIREDEREAVARTQQQQDWELLGPQADRFNPLREESPVNYGDYDAMFSRQHEQQNFQLTERRGQGSELAAMLKRFPEHKDFIMQHKELWNELPQQKPVMQAVNGHIRVTKQGKVKFIPGYLRMVGFEEPAEPVTGPVWAKADGWRIWPRMGMLPRLNFGAMLLVGMVRMRKVTKPSSFHVLVSEIPDLDWRTKSRLWDFFHRVMHKVDPVAYKAWVSRRKAK